MQVTPMKLFNRDFSLLVIGQTVSIFGNMILSFALPLFILDISGSPALFGLVLSLPYIPLIMVSPIGGIIADRLKKQQIMFWLDITTTFIILIYMALSGFVTAIVPVVIVKLMALNAIQGLYLPAVQSSVPLLAHPDKLVPANAVVTMINQFSSMAGMAIAGILYASFGLFPILAVSAVCFAITAVMDLFIRIPYKKQEIAGSRSPKNLFQIAKSDVVLAAKFIVKDKPVLARSGMIVFYMQISLVSMFLVGIPVMITQILGLGMELVGISQSIMFAGGLLGGIIAGTLGTRLTIKAAPFLLMLVAVLVIPMGLVFLFEMPALQAYIIITAASALTLVSIQVASIQMMAFVQRETPTELTGKVMSLLVILPFVANALGQLIYGVFFEQFYTLPWIVVFVTVVFSAAIAFYSRSVFGKYGSPARAN